ncbi:MAG: PhnD/SsuA/transferrin family substrate-binding protein [Thermodesulfobacteriota bacterium]
MTRSRRYLKIIPLFCLVVFLFLALQLGLNLFTPSPLYAQDKTPIKIGVLAKRGYEQSLKKWEPTASYLSQALPSFTFKIIPRDFDEIRQSVADGGIDFVITNSAYYVHLEFDYGTSRIATLKNLINHVPEKRFGGVIFTRADKKEISTFKDLKGIKFQAVDPDSLGGWQMAWREFNEHGISPRNYFKSLTFAGTHDKVVYAVLEGKADAGTVRTDTLERMAAEGKIDLAAIKVLHPSDLTTTFNYQCSTRLYPEWPFAKLKHTPDSLAEKVSIALLSMPPDSEAARAASISGWTVPLDYQPVHELLQELHLGPYQRHLGPIAPWDFFQQYKAEVFTVVAFFVLLLLSFSYVVRLNGSLQQAKKALGHQLVKIKRAENNYREIFNATNEAIFVNDIKDGSILDVNQSMCDMYGYSTPDEVKNINIGDLCSGEYPYTSGQAAKIISQTLSEGDKTFIWHAQKKDGSLFWVEVTLKPAFIGGKKRFLAVVHDITERKTAEEELERYRLHLEDLIKERSADLIKSEASLAEAQRLAHLGSWQWSINDGRLWWSEETYRIFGLDVENSPIDYDSFLSTIHPDDRQMVEQAVEDALQGKLYDIEHRIVRPDGTIRIVQERGNIFFGDAKTPQTMVGSVQDITDRKKYENDQLELRSQLNQAQKLEAIGTMAGGIAHDFNNILGAINGYTELSLIKLEKDSEVAPLLEQVMRSGNRAKDLVSQILTFSRKEKLHHQLIAIAPIIKESLKLLRATIPANIDLRAKIEANTSKIMGDPTQIHQIILNLCTNAHHAMELQQGGVLCVELVNEEIDEQHPQATNLAPGQYVKLSVSDNGSGISPENLERIFDPFFTTKALGKGTGMGLSVVHGIVRSYNGNIVASSKKGEGSTFTIYLPALASENQQPEPISVKEEVQGGNEKILFVDDEPSLVELGQLILEHLGYEVTALTSSSEALELIKKDPDRFDLLITDQSMPKMTGCQLAQKAMAVKPDIPIILCSGYGSFMSQKEVKLVGIKHFIQKPYNTAKISAVLREVLGNL